MEEKEVKSDNDNINDDGNNPYICNIKAYGIIDLICNDYYYYYYFIKIIYNNNQRTSNINDDNDNISDIFYKNVTSGTVWLKINQGFGIQMNSDNNNIEMNIYGCRINTTDNEPNKRKERRKPNNDDINNSDLIGKINFNLNDVNNKKMSREWLIINDPNDSSINISRILVDLNVIDINNYNRNKIWYPFREGNKDLEPYIMHIDVYKCIELDDDNKDNKYKIRVDPEKTNAIYSTYDVNVINNECAWYQTLNDQRENITTEKLRVTMAKESKLYLYLVKNDVIIGFAYFNVDSLLKDHNFKIENSIGTEFNFQDKYTKLPFWVEVKYLNKIYCKLLLNINICTKNDYPYIYDIPISLRPINLIGYKPCYYFEIKINDIDIYEDWNNALGRCNIQLTIMYYWLLTVNDIRLCLEDKIDELNATHKIKIQYLNSANIKIIDESEIELINFRNYFQLDKGKIFEASIAELLGSNYYHKMGRKSITYSVSVDEDFELNHFPFDCQDIPIEIKPNNFRNFIPTFNKYHNIVEISSIAQGLGIFNYENCVIEMEKAKYLVNKDEFTGNINVNIKIKRIFMPYLYDYILPLFCISLLSLTVFAIDKIEIADRLDVVLGLILALIFIDKPGIPVTTLVDLYYYFSFLYLMFITVMAAFAGLIDNNDDNDAAYVVFSGIAFVVYNVGFLIAFYRANTFENKKIDMSPTEIKSSVGKTKKVKKGRIHRNLITTGLYNLKNKC